MKTKDEDSRKINEKPSNYRYREDFSVCHKIVHDDEYDHSILARLERIEDEITTQ